MTTTIDLENLIASKTPTIMRAKDIHMAATIDPESRIIMVSGAIDRNDQTIVMRIPVPEPGLWTIAKAEVNLTDKAWISWQITLGEGISIPTENGLLLSRQFRQCKYMSKRHAIMFYDGEVRPGDAIFKMARLQVEGTEMALSHSRMPHNSSLSTQDIKAAVEHGFGDEFPKIEVYAPVRIVKPDDIDTASFRDCL